MNFSSLIVNDSIIPLISFNFILLIFFLSDELTITEINSKKAFSKPSSITSVLLKFISNGLDISMFSITKDFASIFSV